MKSFFLSLAVAVLLFVGVQAASAQNGPVAPYVDAGISATHSTGTVGLANPNYRVGGGIESSTKHLLLDANVQFDSANLSGFRNVLNANGGYTATVTGSAYLKLHGFLAGGGAFYSNQVVSENFGNSIASINRDQVRPFIGGGYQFSSDRILVNYVLPGQDNIGVLNDLNLGDRTIQVRNEIFLGKTGFRKHLRFTQNLDVSSNLLNGAGTRQTAVTAGAGLKLVL